MKKIFKRLIFIIPVIAGILLLVTMVKNKQAPNRPEIVERSRTVSAITMQATSIIPRVTGYGYVHPTEKWEAISEVSGQIVKMHPELKKGAFFNKGELLLQIDPKSYGFAESKGQATIESVEAQLIELDQQKKNAERLLAVELKAKELTQNELERKRLLTSKGILSQSDLEIEEKNMLTHDTAVKNLINTLDLIPSKEKALLAQKDSDESSLGELRLDLERTIIRAPFDCRISEVKTELNQYTPVGSLLLKAINISEVEVPVKLPPSSFVNLLSQPVEVAKLIAGETSMDTLRNMVGISAEVRLPMFHKEAVWEGSFRRTSESVDLETGALTIYVAVPDPYAMVIPGVRPPLVPNLYCEVELRGQKRDNLFVIPLSALHDKKVYLVNEDTRLQIHPVDIEMVMGDFAVISSGLQENDVVVLTDLVPAIEGMLLTTILNEEVAEKIQTFTHPQ